MYDEKVKKLNLGTGEILGRFLCTVVKYNKQKDRWIIRLDATGQLDFFDYMDLRTVKKDDEFLPMTRVEILGKSWAFFAAEMNE